MVAVLLALKLNVMLGIEMSTAFKKDDNESDGDLLVLHDDLAK